MSSRGKHIYYNTTDSQVVIDDEGRMLGGGEFGSYTPNTIIDQAVEEGRLIDKGTPQKEENQDIQPEAESEVEAATETASSKSKSKK